MAEFLPQSVLLALAAAVLFGLSDAVIKVGLRRTDPSTGVLVDITGTVLPLWLAAPWVMQAAHWQSPALWLFALVGLFRPFLTANLFFRAQHWLGATLASTVASIYPLFAVAAGALFLMEGVTTLALVGTCLIITGVVVLSWRGRTPVDWPAAALLLPLGTAVMRAAASVLIKLGLTILPSAYMATLVANSVSLLLAATQHGWRVWRRPVPMDPRGLVWFAASGLTASAALLSLNSALRAGEVSTVTPIVAASPLFTMLYSVVLFRTDKLSGRLLAGVLLVLPGVMLVTAFR